jgi:uncharacterized protein YkwD
LKHPTLLFMSVALSLSACADVSNGVPAPESRLALSQVCLDPETARAEINQYRISRGLRPLVINASLTMAARRHAADLSSHDRISHRGSDGTDPWDRVRQTGYEAQLAAENVGTGQRSFGEVLQGWKASPGHNKNLLLPDATQMGVALVVNPESRHQTYWTLVMGRPANATIAARRGN